MAKKSKSRASVNWDEGSKEKQQNSQRNQKYKKEADQLLQGLPEPERKHLERCTLDCAAIIPSSQLSNNGKKDHYTATNNTDQMKNCLTRREFVQQAVSTLLQEHALVLHNCITAEDIQTLRATYQSLREQQSGQTAIGEKDATKRSGTRLYNCLCQLGPACGFYNWKEGTATARTCLNPTASTNNESEAEEQEYNYYNQHLRQKPLWKEITDHFHFTHIARVEVVTSHVGCRAQGWHIDGVHGLTVILPLTDVGVRQGPTEMDFSCDFVGLWEGDPKVRNGSTDRVRAVMPAGSVLMFNANVSHRGSANIGQVDRPICVLDCSLESTCLAKGGPRDIWSV